MATMFSVERKIGHVLKTQTQDIWGIMFKWKPQKLHQPEGHGIAKLV